MLAQHRAQPTEEFRSVACHFLDLRDQGLVQALLQFADRDFLFADSGLRGAESCGHARQTLLLRLDLGLGNFQRGVQAHDVRVQLGALACDLIQFAAFGLGHLLGLIELLHQNLFAFLGARLLGIERGAHLADLGRQALRLTAQFHIFIVPNAKQPDRFVDLLGQGVQAFRRHRLAKIADTPLQAVDHALDFVVGVPVANGRRIRLGRLSPCRRSPRQQATRATATRVRISPFPCLPCRSRGGL